MKKRVIVAMSGGVDSAVTACLLVQQDYEVIGINLKLFTTLYKFTKDNFTHHDVQNAEDAKNVCDKLGIPFYTFNYETEFKEKVINYFYQEYINGYTPNPCIVCNEKIKFGVLFDKAKELNVDYLATGHYAKIEYEETNKRYLLKKAKDKERDQSYFLFSIPRERLPYILFPLADYTKNEVREIAKKFDLKIYNRSKSKEICFIPDNNYRNFLLNQKSFEIKPGLIVNKKGEILGEHRGIAFYTIGQRSKLGSHGKPFYVISIDKEKNTIVVGEEKELYQSKLIAKNLNWIDRERLIEPIKVTAKIRYQHQEAECIVTPESDDTVSVKFFQPQRAITPGQAIVFYDKDTVVGGGWISEATLKIVNLKYKNEFTK